MAKAKRKSIEPTIAAAAKRLGVNQRTLKEWLACGCPGKSGDYDVDAIAAWRSANRAPVKTDETAGRAKWELKKAKAEAGIKTLELRRKQEKLLLVDRAIQVMQQHVAEVRTHLQQLPDKVIASVKLSAAEKKKLRAKISGWVHGYCQQFEASLRSLAKTARHDQRRLTRAGET